MRAERREKEGRGVDCAAACCHALCCFVLWRIYLLFETFRPSTMVLSFLLRVDVSSTFPDFKPYLLWKEVKLEI